MTQAIDFLTSASAAKAAQTIARTMRSENGVQTAVDSFHRHLPLDAMTCDITHIHVARWTVKKHKRVVRLSDQAAAVLLAQKLIKLGDLKP